MRSHTTARFREQLAAALARLGGRPLTGAFERLVGYRFAWDERAGLVVELDLEERHLSQFGVAHGGVTLVLLDTVGGVAAALAAFERFLLLRAGSEKADHVETADEVDLDHLAVVVEGVRTLLADRLHRNGDAGAIDEDTGHAKLPGDKSPPQPGLRKAGRICVLSCQMRVIWI